MSGWRNQAIPLLIFPVMLAGCQAPSAGRVALDLPAQRAARGDAPVPWSNWWGRPDEAGPDDTAGRVEVTSLPDLDEVEGWSPAPVQPEQPAGAEPGWLPPPVREPIPIESARDALSESAAELTLLRRPAESAAADWTRRP